MTENVVGKSDWTNLIETLYRFEGSEMKIEELQRLAKAEEREKVPVKRKDFEGGGSRLGSRTAAKQIPQTRNCSPMKIEDAVEIAP